MTFRKDTFAAAAEAVSVSVSALPKFSDLSVSLKEISAIYVDNSPILAKVNLVAGEDTIRALANFGVEFSGAFLRLIQKRMVLNMLQEQIAVKVALVRGFEKARDAMIELMRHHNIEGIQDARRFEVLRENYDFEANRIAMTNEEIQRLVAELTAKHLPFATECYAESARVNQLLIPLLIAARMELDLSISKERYTEILYQTQTKVAGHMTDFLQKTSEARDSNADHLN